MAYTLIQPLSEWPSELILEVDIFITIKLYSETCLKRTSVGPIRVFEINRCSVYTGLN
jgi:hypothetical protein